MITVVLIAAIPFLDLPTVDIISSVSTRDLGRTRPQLRWPVAALIESQITMRQCLILRASTKSAIPSSFHTLNYQNHPFCMLPMTSI